MRYHSTRDVDKIQFKDIGGFKLPRNLKLWEFRKKRKSSKKWNIRYNIRIRSKKIRKRWDI